MTAKEHRAIRAIIAALSVPRNRFGKLDGDFESSRELSLLAASTPQIPHGGVDRVDQAVMVLQYLVGEKPTSIRDY